jgi:hypothetical protein
LRIGLLYTAAEVSRALIDYRPSYKHIPRRTRGGHFCRVSCLNARRSHSMQIHAPLHVQSVTGCITHDSRRWVRRPHSIRRRVLAYISLAQCGYRRDSPRRTRGSGTEQKPPDRATHTAAGLRWIASLVFEAVRSLGTACMHVWRSSASLSAYYAVDHPPIALRSTRMTHPDRPLCAAC